MDPNAYAEHDIPEAEENLERAEALLQGKRVRLTTTLGGATDAVANEQLQIADPKFFLAELLTFFEGKTEAEITEAFVKGINNYGPNYDSRVNSGLNQDIQELSRNLARLITGFDTFYHVDHPFLKPMLAKLSADTVEDFKVKILPLLRAINRALAARTRYYEESGSDASYGISRQCVRDRDNLKTMNEKMGLFIEGSIEVLPYLWHDWVKREEALDASHKNPWFVSNEARVRDLLKRVQALRDAKGQFYLPLTYVPSVLVASEQRYFPLSLDQIFALFEDQVVYLERFAEANEQRKAEEKTKAAESAAALKARQDKEISGLRTDIEGLTTSVADLSGPGEKGVVTARNNAAISAGSLNRAKELVAKELLDNIIAVKAPGLLRKSEKYINEVLEVVDRFIEEVQALKSNNTFRDNDLIWEDLPKGEIMGPEQGATGERYITQLGQTKDRYESRKKLLSGEYELAERVKVGREGKLDQVIKGLGKLRGAIGGVVAENFKKAELPAHCQKIVQGRLATIAAI